jgi:hypothetical protein
MKILAHKEPERYDYRLESGETRSVPRFKIVIISRKRGSAVAKSSCRR